MPTSGQQSPTDAAGDWGMPADAAGGVSNGGGWQAATACRSVSVVLFTRLHHPCQGARAHAGNPYASPVTTGAEF